MKAFFEEYGFVLVSIVVVMMLVAMVPTIGESVETKLTSLTSGLAIVDDDKGNPSLSLGD